MTISASKPELAMFEDAPSAKFRSDPAPSTPPHIVVLDVQNVEQGRTELAGGLLAAPASINPKFFYDAQGCALFGAICQLSEYYLTRCEAEIFRRYRAAIAAQLPVGGQWIDLGCGDCLKSRDWIKATAVQRYIGVDIAEDFLLPALVELSRIYSGLECVGVVTDFTRPLNLEMVLDEADLAPVFFYPGSSIGNFEPEQALHFLRSIHRHLAAREDGRLLIGVDLVKPAQILQAAYDDALGVTAAFNRNALRVCNRMLGTDFDLGAFEHRAFFDEASSRIEMQLQARTPQRVVVDGVVREFAAGESIVTEYSCKYTLQSFRELLNTAGFSQIDCWTDEWNAKLADADGQSEGIPKGQANFAVFLAGA